MKRRDVIEDPKFIPPYVMKNYLPINDPAYKPEYKLKKHKTLVEKILSPWRPVSSLDAGTASVSMPAVRGPPEVKPISIIKKRPIPLVSDGPIVELNVPEIVVPEPEYGSREWKKQQFKLTNFI